MPWKWNSSKAKLGAWKQAALKTLEKGVIQTLSYLGEQCVNHARSLNTYRDVTGNLRSSIGYVIVRNGQVVKSGFTGASGRKGGATGVKTGQELAHSLASEAGQGWVLIVVAGMNYALAVESRGLDVLASAEQLAQSELPRMLADLKQDVTASIA